MTTYHGRGERADTRSGPVTFHRLALVAMVVLTATYVSILADAIAVMGWRSRLLVFVGIAIVAAFISVGWLSDRVATILAVIVLSGGTIGYAMIAPGGLSLLVSAELAAQHVLALLTGFSVLTIVGVEFWILAITPAPVYLSWYLVFKRYYAGGVAVGLLVLLFLMATGDAGHVHGLVGVLASIGAVGCGELHRRRAKLGEIDLLAIVLAIVLVASLTVSVIPGEGQQPIGPETGVGGVESTESDILMSGDELEVSGSPSLDPEVRYTITADEPVNWRVDAFDRYTGTGWERTGTSEPFRDASPPPGGEPVNIEAETEVNNLRDIPSIWRPVDVEGVDHTIETSEDGLHSVEPMPEGNSIAVQAIRPTTDRERLAGADDEVPDEIRERYTQVPDSTPDRVSERTAEVIADANSTYAAAQHVEQYLMETNEYSLDVPAPEGDIADEMLFERDEGYCTFFATTMAAMLRTQDIPTRVVTGYSTGEQVDEDRWVVRGMNAHAWVEVYIHSYGWITFDPTPSDPYNDARENRLTDAREDGEENVDTAESAAPDWEPTPGAEPDADSGIDGPDPADCETRTAIEDGLLTESEARSLCTPDQLEAMHGIDPAADTGSGDADTTAPIDDPPDGGPGLGIGAMIGEIDPPSAEQATIIGGLLVAMLAIGSRRGLGGQLGGWFDNPLDVEGTPAIREIEDAWLQLEAMLTSTYEERSASESVRAYLARLEEDHELDPRVREVAGAREHARYGPGTPSEATVDEVQMIVDQLVDGDPDSI